MRELVLVLRRPDAGLADLLLRRERPHQDPHGPVSFALGEEALGGQRTGAGRRPTGARGFSSRPGPPAASGCSRARCSACATSSTPWTWTSGRRCSTAGSKHEDDVQEHPDYLDEAYRAGSELAEALTGGGPAATGRNRMNVKATTCR
ncbi:MAG: hypothetical protein MZV70_40140 [Desulfobacterales bacterium]|nr:hypothetical protein [Desulfobacterales bacterium]